MIKNILKIVVLGVLGFSALVYFTAPKQKEINIQDANKTMLSKGNLPSTYELVGQTAIIQKNELFKENMPYLIIVGNHDSLAVVKDLNKYFTLKMPLVLVANISSAPWFVKKMFIPNKLEELNKETNIPMIYDFNGSMANALHVTDNTKTAFAAYVLNEDGTIFNVYTGNVKEGALDGSMSEDEKKEVLKTLVEML